MTIKIDQHTDAFTLHVYNGIDPKARASFSPSQVHAIETAIRANKPYQKHPVDIRGVLPLFFARFYFVILIGRDKREPIRRKEAVRRRKTALGGTLLSVYVVLCMLIPIVFLAVYMLKSFVGIDLFPGYHLEDLVSLF